MQFHINSRGEAGPCKAMVQCPFGDLETQHYETAELARAAYEAKMSANPHADLTAPYMRWRRGKRLSTRDLNELPTGATVRWTYFDRDGGWSKSHADYEKVSPGKYRCVDHEDNGRLIQSQYLGGAGGNERAQLVSVQGLRSDELPPEQEKKPRTPAAPKFGILCISNVSDSVYLDYAFARESSARKKMAELNLHDYLHHSYELVSYEEAQARMSQDRTKS